MTFRLILVAVSVCCFVASSRSQGILGDTDSKAIDCLTKVVTAPLDLPNEYAVLIRMENFVVSGRMGPATTDSVYAFSENVREKSRYAAYGLMVYREGIAGMRAWDQTIVKGMSRSRRAGNTVPPYAKHVTEELGIDPSESQTVRSLPEFYPFFFPIAQRVDVFARRVSSNFGSHLLQLYELEASERTKQGLIKSIWLVNKVQVQIEFDPKQDDRPVRIILVGPPEGESDERPIRAIQTIKWREWKWGKGESVWVPDSFRRLNINRNSDRETELECRFVWKEIRKESVIPSVEDDDWRERFRVAFNENWKLDFQAWLRLQSTERK